jgi:hypothetical protein
MRVLTNSSYGIVIHQVAPYIIHWFYSCSLQIMKISGFDLISDFEMWSPLLKWVTYFDICVSVLKFPSFPEKNVCTLHNINVMPNTTSLKRVGRLELWLWWLIEINYSLLCSWSLYSNENHGNFKLNLKVCLWKGQLQIFVWQHLHPLDYVYTEACISKKWILLSWQLDFMEQNPGSVILPYPVCVR